MDARRRIGFEQHDRSPAIREELVAGRGTQFVETGPRMFHRHHLARIVGIQRPRIDDLLTVRVDDRYTFAFCDPKCTAVPCRQHNHRMYLWRNCWARSVRGRVKNSSGGAVSTIAPASMNTIVSPASRANAISCVTTIMVLPSFTSWRITAST